MLEWLKRHAWKVCKRQKRFQGSNPCLSAKEEKNQSPISLCYWAFFYPLKNKEINLKKKKKIF